MFQALFPRVLTVEVVLVGVERQIRVQNNAAIDVLPYTLSRWGKAGSPRAHPKCRLISRFNFLAVFLVLILRCFESFKPHVSAKCERLPGFRLIPLEWQGLK